jgi:hypothetical protein
MSNQFCIVKVNYMDGMRVAPSASIGDDEGSYILLPELSKATISMRAPRSFTANVGPTTSSSRLKSLNSVPMFHDNDLITGALTRHLEAPVA